jgi:DNA-binding transcriptional regulator YiaG
VKALVHKEIIVASDSTAIDRIQICQEIILEAAALSRVVIPDDFVFGAGQVFWEDGDIAEIRLLGLIASKASNTPYDEWLAAAKEWTTPVPPKIVLNDGSSFDLADEDRDRSHFSAKLAQTDKGPALLAFWDLSREPEALQKATGRTRAPRPREDVRRELVRVARQTFPLAFGQAIVDTSTLTVVSHIHKVSLPAKKWSTLPAWHELVDESIRTILEEEGERAFQDLREETGDPTARGPLLHRRYKASGEVLQLSVEGERRLKIRRGLAGGYRYVDAKNGHEYFTRLFEAGKGYLEVGLSWFGLAGPWVKDWRERFKRETEAVDFQLPLFEDLDTEQQESVSRRLSRLHMLEDGQRIMEVILGQIGRQGINPVRIPAIVFKVLLMLERDANWKQRVEGALEALRYCEFRVNSFDMGKVIRAYGSFLAEWRYTGSGSGRHGDGDYTLFVTPGFLGCIQIFQSDKRRLGGEVQFDFSKKLSRDDKEKLGWGQKASKTAETFTHIDAGRVFYNAAAGLNAHQKNLVSFLERQITLRRSAISRALGNHTARDQERAVGRGSEPRIYTSEVCALLPTAQRYQGAIGNFKRNAEAGWRLGGTPRREGARGGAHTAGLLHELGYTLPSGRATNERLAIAIKALEDLKIVVEDYLEGRVLVSLKGGRWLTLDMAARLPERALLEQVLFFPFLPEDWRERRKRKWEEHQAARAARGETPHAWAITEDTHEAELARLPGATPGEAPLHHRLRDIRLQRSISQGGAATIFGVTRQALAAWENESKKIPAELSPWVERWIKTGDAPSPEELASRTTSRKGR